MSSTYIPYSKQNLNAQDIEAVVAVLKSSFLTTGPEIELFENAIAEYCGVKHAVAVSNATAGLHLSLVAQGLADNSRVWMSPITFLSSANVAIMMGAKVDFVDVDPVTGNMSAEALQQKLEIAAKKQTLPDVIILVHFGGRVSDLPTITSLCLKYGITIIEDAAHALGARYEDGTTVGCSQHSTTTVFSFHPVKSITTGEGGVITTNDSNIASDLKRLRTHGITRTPSEFSMQQPQGDWYYEQDRLGFNYRLTDIQAALGTSQLKRLDQFISERKHLAESYLNKLSEFDIRLPPSDSNSAWHLFPIGIYAGSDARATVFQRMRDGNIGVNVHYIPVHLQPYYQDLGFRRGDFPASEYFYDCSISIPLYPGLTQEMQNRVCSTLADALR